MSATLIVVVDTETTGLQMIDEPWEVAATVIERRRSRGGRWHLVDVASIVRTLPVSRRAIESMRRTVEAEPDLEPLFRRGLEYVAVDEQDYVGGQSPQRAGAFRRYFLLSLARRVEKARADAAEFARVAPDDVPVLWAGLNPSFDVAMLWRRERRLPLDSFWHHSPFDVGTYAAGVAGLAGVGYQRDERGITSSSRLFDHFEISTSAGRHTAAGDVGFTVELLRRAAGEPWEDVA